MKKEGRINIFGPIGTFMFRGVQVQGVMLADVMDKVLREPADIDYLIIDMESLGGSKDEGNKILSFMDDLKRKGITIETNQVGPIGSVSTKIFLKGDVRTALDDGTKNWFIHNPWRTTEGDATAHINSAVILAAAEEELAKEYVSQTKLTLEQVKPLMEASASFTGEQALTFGFATRINKALNIAAYITMEKNEKTIGQKIDDLIAAIKGGKAPDSSKVLAFKLSDTASLVATATDDKVEGLEIFEADAAGLATTVKPKDGTVPLQDGRQLVIASGKISKIIEKPAVDSVLEAKFNELSDLVKAMQKPAAGLTKADLDSAILALKSEIETGHVPPARGGKNFQLPKTTEADVLEWDRSLKAGEHTEMRKNNPDQWSKLYFAKYKKLPTNV